MAGTGRSDARDGRVELSDARWEHIVDGHPELTGLRELVLTIAARPTRALPGRRPGEQWLYGPGGPSEWLKVVVQWQGGRGSVITAFARRHLP